VALPIGQIEIPEKWHKIPAGFCEALGQAAMSAGTNLSQPALTYVQIKDNKITGTDGHKLLQRTLSDKVLGDLLLPASTARVIAGTGVTEYVHYKKGAEITKRWAHYRTADGTVYSCRCGRAEFPDTERIVEEDGTPVKLPPELPDALSRAAVFDDAVLVTLDGKGLLIKSQSANGWFKEKVAARYRGEPLSFSTRPDLFIDLLGHSGDVEITSGTLRLKGEGFIYMHATQPKGKYENKE
jgi:DNA polymerase III sliding clamp (beta) subunit (PCNA family)